MLQQIDIQQIQWKISRVEKVHLGSCRIYSSPTRKFPPDPTVCTKNSPLTSGPDGDPAREKDLQVDEGHVR